jgi:hypothetical protein
MTQWTIVVAFCRTKWAPGIRELGPGDTRVLATFVALVVALSLLARGVG